MSEKIRQCCRDCKFALFEQNKRGAIKRGEAGKCSYPDPPLPPLPICITRSHFFRPDYPRSAIWPDDGDCPVWEKKADG